MADCVIPEGYKETALGVVPKEWEVKVLGDLCDSIKSGKNKEKANKGKYPVYGSTGIIGYTDISVYDGLMILIARVGANAGFTYYVNGRYDVSDNTLILNVKSCYNFNFAYNQLLYYNLNKLVFGSGQPLVTACQLKSLKILLPPLSEQQKIAEILNVWDKAIEKQTQLIEKLELRKKGLMQQLLTGKKRLPGFGGEWKKVKLGEIGIFFKGFGVSKDEIKSYERYKCLTYGDIYTKYEIKIENVRSFISQDVANISKQIQYGDICFASSGETTKDIGKCAVFVDGDIGYAGGDIIIFRNKTNVNPITLAYILNSEEVNKQKSSLGQGHSVVHIYISNLEKITIKIPDIEEQNAIAEIFTSCDKEIYLANQELKSLHQQKKGLMQVLLTGKKRVKQ